MSCFVNTPGGSGVDLSSLTNGEQWMIGNVLSQFPWFNASNSTNYVELYINGERAHLLGVSNQSDNIPQNLKTPLDFSAVNSISFRYFYGNIMPGSAYRSKQVSASLDLTIYNSTIGSGARSSITKTILSRSTVTPSNGVVSTGEITWDISSYTRNTVFYLYGFGQMTYTDGTSVGNLRSAVSIVFTGFTTTDGKTHTATNLNY